MKMNERNWYIRMCLLMVLLWFVGQTVSAQGHWQFGVKRDVGMGFGSYHNTLHATAGWRFDRKHYLGIGTGCNWQELACDDDPARSNGEVMGIPLFADYVRYIPFRTGSGHSVYWGLEAGGGVYTGNLPTTDDSSRWFPYLNPKLGLDFTINRYVGLNLGFSEIFSEASTVLCVHLGLRF